MNRIITGQATGRRMTVGELRRFLESIEDVADDTSLKAKASFLRGHLKAVPVEENLKHAAAPADVLFGREKSERKRRPGSGEEKADKTDG
jgi:hypothetical protein